MHVTRTMPAPPITQACNTNKHNFESQAIPSTMPQFNIPGTYLRAKDVCEERF